jgi:DNA repair exonuclease SbcCD ATPase subunit
MKKVIFKKIKIKNFLSIGKTPVVIDFVKGFNIITGINKDLMDRQNGIGKSSVVDAFYFSLFGETTRDLKKEFISNNVTNETAEVSLEFSIDKSSYEIIRSIKPSKCTLYENGIDISRDSMANTTEYILSILSLTPEIFSNCICLSINSTVPFMAQKKIDKKKFIEGIFNLDVFSKMNSLLKEDYGQTKKEIETLLSKYDELGNSIKIITSQNEKIKNEREKRRNSILDNIKLYSEQLEKNKEKIASYNIGDNSNSEKKIEKLENKKDTEREKSQNILKENVEILTKIKILKEDLSKIGTSEEECPICLRVVTEEDNKHVEDRKNKIKLEIDNFKNNSIELESKLDTVKEQIVLIERAISVFKKNINDNNLLIQQKKNDEEKILFLEKQIIREEGSLNDLNDSSISETKNIDDLIERYNKFEIEIVKKKKEFKILDNVKFILSEEGVKSYVIKKILNLFNSKIAFYLKELNSNAIITFDQYFEEDIKNERGKPTMYFNYSGAERKAIDLAVMFAFIDMLKLQTNVYYNVQFYDELLDTSLDSAGVENVVRILNEFVEKYSYGIYVISHRKECSKLANGEIVFLEKHNGITKRIDSNTLDF